MNHTAWCPKCNRWRTWRNSSGEKRCVKCSHLCTSKKTGKVAVTGLRFPWYQVFDPLNPLALKWVRWFSPYDKFEEKLG